MMTQEQLADKSETTRDMAQLREFVQDAARNGRPAHEVELGLFRRLLSLGRDLLGEFFARQGSGDMGEQFRLPDGRVLNRLPDAHCREYTTIFGAFTLPRTVYGVRAGQKIEAVPLDARLQLPDSKFSHLLQSWDQLVATEQPYNQVSRVFETIFELRQHTDSLERTSRRLSPDAEDFCWSRPVPPANEEGEILVESADGKGVPIRHAADAPPIQDHQHRPGPKPDRKRMATVGAVYSVDRFVRTPEQVLEALFHDPAEPPSPDAPQRPRPQHKWTYARLDDDPGQPQAVKGQAATFGWLDEQLRARLKRRRKEVPVVCLMDGQETLWSMQEQMQPDLETVQILDLLHVTPRLWTAAKLFHPRDESAAESFVREQTRRMLHGQVKTVIHSLRARATRRGLTAAAQSSLAEICGYFHKHRHRMRYDEYLRAGYPIASGVIEGACRHVVKDRLERTGMSWTRPGAQALLNLRAIWTCDQWDQFDTYRIERETARLYPYRESLPTLEWPLAT
jgi:hypothetical protein